MPWALTSKTSHERKAPEPRLPTDDIRAFETTSLATRSRDGHVMTIAPSPYTAAVCDRTFLGPNAARRAKPAVVRS